MFAFLEIIVAQFKRKIQSLKEVLSRLIHDEEPGED